MARIAMKRRNVSLDETTENLINLLVPKVYPSRSELIRSLVREEIERKGIRT